MQQEPTRAPGSARLRPWDDGDVLRRYQSQVGRLPGLPASHTVALVRGHERCDDRNAASFRLELTADDLGYSSALRSCIHCVSTFFESISSYSCPHVRDCVYYAGFRGVLGVSVRMDGGATRWHSVVSFGDMQGCVTC